MNVNPYALFGVFSSFIAIVVLVYVCYKQLLETTQPRNWLTNLRWYILVLLMVSAMTAVPALAYQLVRVQGHDSHTLRNFVTITSNISKLTTSFLLLMIWNYKRKVDK